VLLLGAGGASRAALYALAQAGAAWIGVVNRTRARAESLLEDMSAKMPQTQLAAFPLDPPKLLAELGGSIDLLVNSSALGLHGEPMDLPLAGLVREGGGVYDMVYGGQTTALVRSAQAVGVQAADGRGMLAGQGEAAFALWFGVNPPAGIMRQALKSVESV